MAILYGLTKPDVTQLFILLLHLCLCILLYFDVCNSVPAANFTNRSITAKRPSHLLNEWLTLPSLMLSSQTLSSKSSLPTSENNNYVQFYLLTGLWWFITECKHCYDKLLPTQRSYHRIWKTILLLMIAALFSFHFGSASRRWSWLTLPPTHLLSPYTFLFCFQCLSLRLYLYQSLLQHYDSHCSATKWLWILPDWHRCISPSVKALHFISLVYLTFQAHRHSRWIWRGRVTLLSGRVRSLWNSLSPSARWRYFQHSFQPYSTTHFHSLSVCFIPFPTGNWIGLHAPDVTHIITISIFLKFIAIWFEPVVVLAALI